MERERDCPLLEAQFLFFGTRSVFSHRYVQQVEIFAVELARICLYMQVGSVAQLDSEAAFL